MGKNSFILTALLFVFLFGFAEVAMSQVEGEPYVKISVLKIDEAKIDGAIDLLSELQLSTLESEDGCIAYDVLLSDDDSTQAFIYESYESEDAYNKHLKSKHYIEIYTKKLKPMLKEVTTTKVFLLNFEGVYSDEVI
ncbi:MAG: antibiotic biosynthesis monooxygenase [Proteiniphilum sp.]|nr:antibiotic biosynthesis monooxygenase [Proteiniphilum sp.]